MNYRIMHFWYFLLLKIGCVGEPCIILAYKDVQWVRKVCFVLFLSLLDISHLVHGYNVPA